MKRSTKFFNFIPLLIAFNFLLGCGGVPEPQVRVIDTIIIKNSTNDFIKQVSVSKNFSIKATKVGSISPVLAQSEQVFERPDKAQRLPDSFQVQWISSRGVSFQKNLIIKPFLESASKKKAKTLVLEIDRIEDIKAYVY